MTVGTVLMGRLRANRQRLLLVLAVAVLTAAGCGGDDSVAAPPTDETEVPVEEPEATEAIVLQLSTDPGGALVFDKVGLAAPAGEITIVMENPAPEIHNVSVEGENIETVDGEFAQPGETSTVRVMLEPGTYVFYCAVPGHRASGMEGTLTVS